MVSLQDRSLAIDAYFISSTLPRLVSLLSLLSVICTVIEAYGDHRRFRLSSSEGNVITHVQLAYQFPLFLWCVVTLFGRVPVPPGERTTGSYGNENTCSAQGFVMSVAYLGSILWDITLSTTFLLIVRYNWTEGRVYKLIVPWIHFIIWPICLGVSTVFLVGGHFVSLEVVCWVDVTKMCQGDDCFRNAAWWLVALALILLPVCALIWSVYVMGKIYGFMRHLEEQNVRHVWPADVTRATTRADISVVTSPPSPSHHRTSRAVGLKGMLYAGTFAAATTPLSIVTLLIMVSDDLFTHRIKAFAGSFAALLPFFNMVVFLMNRTQMHSRYGRVIKSTLTKGWDCLTYFYRTCKGWMCTVPLPPRSPREIMLAEKANSRKASSTTVTTAHNEPNGNLGDATPSHFFLEAKESAQAPSSSLSKLKATEAEP